MLSSRWILSPTSQVLPLTLQVFLSVFYIRALFFRKNVEKKQGFDREMASIRTVSAIDSHEKVQKIGINARWSFEYGIWILNAVENTNQSELQHMLHRIPLYILRVIPTPQLYRSLHKSWVGCATPYIKPLRKLYCVAVQSHKTNLYLHFKDLCLLKKQVKALVSR